MSEQVKQEGEFKIKRPKKFTDQPDEIKVDLTKKQEDAVQESEPAKVVLQSNEEEKKQEVGLQEVGSTHEEQEPTKEVEEVKPVLEEVKNTPTETRTEVETTVAQEKTLPENIDKLVKFMEETGGTVEDYVRINKDYSNVDEKTLLNEYYKNTRPHLDQEEISFLMEDSFGYDEEEDEERTIRKKRLAYKEEVAKARKFLEDTKSKYYDEIKLRPGVTQEQQKAIDFFNRYNDSQKKSDEARNFFTAKTKDYFNNFEGFNFNLGEKSFKYKVPNPSDVADKQSNLQNLVGKFLNEDGVVNDYDGYHKAIFAAGNADALAKHFYEQGVADATKDIIAKSKNISNEPRTTSNGEVFINGLKVKAITGSDGRKLKIQKRK